MNASLSCKLVHAVRVKRTFALGAAAAAMLQLSAAPASAQGLLQILFGAKPAQPQYRQAPNPVRELTIPGGRAARDKLADKKRAKKKLAREAERSTKPKIMPRPPVLAGPLGHFMLDPTLYRGDIVVTTQGLKVFSGHSRRGQHSPGDFVDISRSKGVGGAHRTALLAIDRANRLSDISGVRNIAEPVKGKAPAPIVASDPPKPKAASKTKRKKARKVRSASRD